MGSHLTIVRWQCCAMRYAFIFVVISLLLTACERRDTKLREQIIGTWTHGDSGVMTLDSNGSFQSRWTIALTNITKEWKYDGAWNVKDGVLICVITNSSAINSTNSVPIGSMEHWKLIRADASHLVLANGNETNLFDRK